ncbi:MAG: ferritin family protein [Arenicellales bacterium]|nr:ferritin family protein [Arenicellales bacterium]
MSLSEKICDMDTFLAYSIALEEEAAERHDELADMMEVHNNPEVAKTFRKLAHFSRLHAQEVRDRATGCNLPAIAPWDFGWEDMEGPETGDIGEVNYLMHTAQALRIAMGNEKRAHDFYDAIGRDSPDASVRSLAAEFAEEEREHLKLLEKWLEECPNQDEEMDYDPDPPHTPE